MVEICRKCGLYPVSDFQVHRCSKCIEKGAENYGKIHKKDLEEFDIGLKAIKKIAES